MSILNETQDARDAELAVYTGRTPRAIRALPIGARESLMLYKDEDCTEESFDFIYATFPFIEDRAHLLRSLTHYIVTRRKHYMVRLGTLVGPWGGIRVLDFGCGVGSHGIHCAEEGASVDFLDVDGPLYDYAKWRLARRKLTAGLLHAGDALAPGEYDVALCLDVLEHVAEPVKTLRGILDALVPGGLLALEVSHMIKPTSGHFVRNIQRWKAQGPALVKAHCTPISAGLWRKRDEP